MIVLEEVFDTRTFDIVREVISPELLTDYQIRQWAQIPRFSEEILKTKENAREFSGANVLWIMKKCLKDMGSSGLANRNQIEVLKRSCKILERNSKRLRNYDELHWEIKQHTKLLHREISVWERVPEFKNDLYDLKRDGTEISNQGVLRIMRHILELNPASVEISGVNTELLRNATVRFAERIQKMEGGTVG